MLERLCICRCCLSNGCYKDIGNEYFFSGQREVYADLLLSTFNVTISHKEGTGPSGFSRLICESCIQRLRDAAAFKQQILDAENNIEILLRKLTECKKEQDTTKRSKTDIYNQNDNDSYSEHSYGDDDHEFIDATNENCATTENCATNEKCVTIEKCATIEKNTTIKSSATNKNDKVSDEFDLDLDDEVDSYAFDGFDEEGHLLVVHLINKEEIKISKQSKPMKKVKKRTNSIRNKENDDQGNTTKRKRNKDRTLQPGAEKIIKLKANTIQLVINSNLCLFKSRKNKYGCFFCSEMFFTTTELRKHCDKEHNNEIMVRKSLRNISTYKNADINNLACKLCQRPCGDLDDLQGHLVDLHKVTFNPEGHFLMSYKFCDYEFNCFLCGLEFLSFSRLNIHMNTHFPHNMCEVCGAGYTSKVSLRLHMKVHGEKRCNLCECKFTTTNQKMRHMFLVHGMKQINKYKCNMCSDHFKYFYLLRKHKLEAHGAGKSRQYSCDECDKIFKHHNNLKVHKRSVHLRERRYQCSSCDKSFFTSTDKRRHERSHGQATIPCVHCSTSFKTKDSWRRHQRRLHPDTLK